MTQLEQARRGQVTEQMRRAAVKEGLHPDVLLQAVASGSVVIPANKNHKGLEPIGVGKGLRTKVNANIGTSEQYPDLADQLRNLEVALQAGADTVMDLSTGGDIDLNRRSLLERCPVPLGTVPVYQAAVKATQEGKPIVAMDEDDLFQAVQQQAEDGVDFMTIHCGLTLNTIERLRRQGRTADIVSRGGSFMLAWMLYHEKENPFYSNFDRLLDIARRYDVTLSLGDAMRPGCLEDASDRAQIEELIILGELTQRAWDAGVQVMIEGPGHVPMDQIAANVKLQKTLCKGAPFYVLGPIVTDVAPGYDHITAAIGGALAAAEGADFLCYVTPAEHLGLPSLDEVKAGVVAARIAAHAADLVKGVQGAREWDHQMAAARKALDWESQRSLAIDPSAFDRYQRNSQLKTGQECSMCGRYCAMKLVSQFLGSPAEHC